MLTRGVCSHIPRCQASGRKPSLKALWTVNFVYAHSLASLLLDMVPSHVHFGRRRRLVPVSQLVLLEWRLICVCYSAPKKDPEASYSQRCPLGLRCPYAHGAKVGTCWHMLEEDVALKCQIDSGSLLRHKIPICS